jgi:membrane protease YdiL (CAAX protease family)
LVYAIFLALRGGVAEEVLYRGLAIEQLTVLTGRRWLAASIAGVIFVLAHSVHFDVHQLIPIAAATLGMTALYLWRRNLWINIIAHVLVDAVALVVVALRVTELY